MGLFSRIRNGVAGTAQIVGCSYYGGEGAYSNCRMQLVVTVPGSAPYSVEVHQLAPRKKWPQPGLTVPVMVSPKDPQKVKVDFDKMPTTRELAQQSAEQQAAWLRGDAPMLGAPGVPNVQVIGGDISDVPPERLAQIEQMLGIDLDGDGHVGGAGGGGGSGGDDRVGRLERLARLHESGALTDAEFAAEKRRILDA